MFDSGVYTKCRRDYGICVIGIPYASGDAIPDINGEVNYGVDLTDGNTFAPLFMKVFAIVPLLG